MRLFFKKLLVLPTWILVALIRPFLGKLHGWKNQRFTLSNWAMNSTKLNDSFSKVGWVAIGYLILMTLYIMNMGNHVKK